MAMFLNILKKKANRCIRLFLLLPIIIFSIRVGAQTPDQNLQIAYRHFLNFQLDSCQEVLERIPENPQSFYLEILLASTKVFVNDDVAQFKANKSQEDLLFKKLKTLPFSEPEKIFLEAETRLQWAILKLKNGEELAAFWSLKQAYNLTKENIKQYPDFIPSYKTMGILHILYGVFPDKYQWVLSMFGIEGDVHAGLEELEKPSKSHGFIALEAGLTKALMQAYLLNEPEKGAEKALKIHEQNSHLLVDYAYALILIKNAQSEKALEIIQAAEQKYPQPLAIAQMYYAKAETLLQKGQYEDAIQFYQCFLSVHSGKQLIKDSYYKIGICHWIKEEPELAEKYFELAKSNGWAKNEADKNADHELNSAHLSTGQLYQLRYASDGGYYENALKIHEGMEISKLGAQDKCEYYYRSARLFHKTQDLKDAIQYYQKTMDCHLSEDWYFAPNSALQLGLIYKKQNNLGEAKRNLLLVNEYDNYPYENSIRQKAKTALEDLK